jgi:hypothetical protein
MNMSSPTEPCSGVQAAHQPNPDCGPGRHADGLRDLDIPLAWRPGADEHFAEATKAHAPAKELVLPVVQELDLLRYAVLFERHQRLHVEYELAQTRVAMAAQMQKANGDELGALLDALGTKYNVDFHKHRIQPDGTIVPLEPR